MRLPRSAIEEFTRQINFISDEMKAAYVDVIGRVDWTDWNKARDDVIWLSQMYGRASSDAAAVIASNFYDLARQYAGVTSPYTPIVDSGYIPEATEQAVSDFFATSGATKESVVQKCVSRLGYETRRAAGDTVINCGSADKARPRYARVPSGSETCPFCMMLASRGFVYSKKGANAHYHDNCDCRIVPGFQGATQVEGYDPEECYTRWQEMVNAQAEKRAERDDTTVRSAKRDIIEALEAPL